VRFIVGHSARVNARRGAANNRFNGGLSARKDGRGLIVCRDGTLMLYSRGVMAAHVGRLLRPDELVHHVNEDPSDDRIENLEITTRPAHARHHRAKVTAEQATDIRYLRSAGWNAQGIADAYGIKRTTVYSIANGHSWSDA
jgi:hypothetical protein